MRKIVILGSGAGGTMVAANLRKELDEEDWQITVIDKDEQHHFQSGYLFIPFRHGPAQIGNRQGRQLRLRLSGDRHRLQDRSRGSRRHDGRLA